MSLAVHLSTRALAASGLAPVELDLAAGRLLGVCGGGGGALLRCLAGVRSITGGSATLRAGDEEVQITGDPRTVAWLRRAWIGFFNGAPRALPSLSGAAAATRRAARHGVAVDEGVAGRLLEDLGAPRAARLPVGLLDGSEQRAVALAGCLLAPLPLLLLDRPLEGLSAAAGERVEALLAEAREDGRAILATVSADDQLGVDALVETEAAP